jgi:hypothetical protein
MATEAEIPGYMDPIFRFKNGDGELTVAGNGAAFNLWDALRMMDDQEFPIVIGQHRLSRDELLESAAHLLADDPEAPRRLGTPADAADEIVRRCIAAGFDPASIS